MFSGYQTRAENRRFFEDLKRRASDIDGIEFVKGDFNSLPSTSFGIRDIEQIKDGAVERQYTGVIYIYAKKDELPVPAGYAVVAMTAGYQRPTIEELPRHPITGILLSGEVVSIYLAPEFRGQGGASFIGEAINSVYGHDLLRSIDQFYSNLLETPPPVELSFSADTISSGGMSVMDALDDELEMLRDMFLETSALEDISVSVAYS
jgi:GNAT superfamily N-acetyltransferase